VTIDVEVLRDGRSASQVAADLRVDGKLVLRAHGVFGIAHDTDLGFLDVQFPDVRARSELEIPSHPKDSVAARSTHQLPRTDRLAPDRRVRAVDLRLQGRPARIRGVDALQCEPQLPDGSTTRSRSRCNGDVIGPAVGQGLGRSASRTWCFRSRSASARRDTGHALVLQEIEAWHVGDGYATGPRASGTKTATSAPSPPRPRTSASCPHNPNLRHLGRCELGGLKW